MPIELLAFDLEISKVFPDNTPDWKQHRPFGISCASTFSTACESPRNWHGLTADGRPSSQMSSGEASALVSYLIEKTNEGFAIVTWNGLSFDFDVLAEESGMVTECRELARAHIDMMFHIFCVMGYPAGLGRVAKGLGLVGKTEGISGSMAPRMWQDGKHQEVLEYCAQDVRTTLEIALAGERMRSVRWTSNSNKPVYCGLPNGWLPVSEAILLPLPDTSWMTSPRQRSEFTVWMG